MFVSLVFTLFDILVVTNVLRKHMPDGIDPFWQLSMVFKCLTDTMVLDDFKSALDRLHAATVSRITAPEGRWVGPLNSADYAATATTSPIASPRPSSHPAVFGVGDGNVVVEGDRRAVEGRQQGSSNELAEMKSAVRHYEFFGRKQSRDRDS